MQSHNKTQLQLNIPGVNFSKPAVFQKILKTRLSAPVRKSGYASVQVKNAVQSVESGSVQTGDLLPWQQIMSQVRKRDDIKSVMIIGAGPIVIGQACEFDYSGTQACKALKAEGYKVILLNSNPATIMTDPETADRTFICPMTPEAVEQILEKERPDAILPTMGGQTGLNLAKTLAESGILDKYGIELIGAKLPSIDRAEDRELFKEAMIKIGLNVPKSGTASTMEEAYKIVEEIGKFPVIIRPAYTLGGTGGGIAYNKEDFDLIVDSGLTASMTSQVLIEQSLLGWKEYELEVMRDLGDNVVIICSIENVDPMGVHTGDSVTVAPAQTLTDKEYQRMRDAAVAIIREMGVECGGSNCQFAVNPDDGELMVIEMNPRVSRSSALASKATGFPIAKMAAKLAMGYTLDQIPNDITRKTPASFEPSIDYIVTKIPRFAFEKFPASKASLTTQMKSVGETMALGRTWQESLQKALRGLETGLDGWSLPSGWKTLSTENMMDRLATPDPERLLVIKQAFQQDVARETIQGQTRMDPWWLAQLEELQKIENWLKTKKLNQLTQEDMIQIKRRGFSDSQISRITGAESPFEVRAYRKSLQVIPKMKRVDTCAAEFEADTPYLYSSYDGNSDESFPTTSKKVLILGGGPNRIGQGIEFDYCCCHASYALRDEGYETIMMNSNPETVSTDYDTSSRLYFEPVTVEDVLNVVECERPDGIIVQFGGQTPLKLANDIQYYLDQQQIQSASGNGIVQIWGTPPDAIDRAEDRDRWMDLLKDLGIRQPAGGSAINKEQAFKIAQELGYPVMVRPSYVLGGRAMEIVQSDQQLEKYLTTAVEVEPGKPVLVDKYLAGAVELDVDALCDKNQNVVICGVMEHIEQAGVHSGDSACYIPPRAVAPELIQQMKDWSAQIAKKLGVIGLINIQYCIQGNDLYIIEANPRASRTVPFVAKAIGRPIAKYASLLMAGKTLEDIGFTEDPKIDHVAVKEVVLPWIKFPGVDPLLGPEMRSTGEVMGIDKDYGIAFAKAQIAAGENLPTEGGVFISVKDEHKESIKACAKQLSDLGYKLYATGGTKSVIESTGVECEMVYKMSEKKQPHASQLITDGKIKLIFITTSGDEPEQKDGILLRRQALTHKVPVVTTVSGAINNVDALKKIKESTTTIQQIALQDYFSVPQLQ